MGLLVIVLVEGGRARAALGDIVRPPLPALLLGALAIVAPFLLISLGVGAMLTFPVALVTAEHELPGTRAVLAVILLGLVCKAVAFVLYYSLSDQVGEERAALGNYLTPIFAIFYGVVLLGERLAVAAVVGLALIIVGAEITLRADSAKRAGGKAKAHQCRARPPFH
jgi:drug/metabolite transporter (DMT)-like permease